MAYPKYNIVVIVDPTTGETAATAFTSKVAAKAAYVVAINAGKQSYLYLQPMPSASRRKSGD